ncbi:hypothetical protein PMZ80_008657 [Knufia obscura]|uniref:Disease resistance R13L4/SHOC-2-like LRR domain-containing protein n=1 Tax=Knufia obscura TaxID=1635080 RepID=A0ABR0RGL9_9EURO|nr:hypothetical protein PMZ80_008657 [Knufia obscura]
MDQGASSRRGNQSNIARPISRLPTARASSIPAAIHQDEPSKHSQQPRIPASSSRKPLIRPLGESNSTSTKPSFGWTDRSDGILSPTRTASPIKSGAALDTTPPSIRPESAIIEEGNENASSNQDAKNDEFAKPEKRRPRPSLSERTIETLSQISPAPSPSRRRSSTVRSSGSMGPPARPASAMRMSRPNTPSTPSSGRAPSPVKRPFRPPGKPATPAKEIPAPLDTIYTPPRAFVRDHSSRIGRPRDTRRSISTAITAPKDNKSMPKSASQAVKVKSMYDLRAAAASSSRTLSNKPSMPTLAKDPITPAKGVARKTAFRDISPHTGLMKARHPGENVIASTTSASKPSTKMQPPLKRTVKRAPTPSQPQKQDSTSAQAAKSSASLRDTIAKAKAARREELRKSGMQADSVDQQWTEHDVPALEPAIIIGSQSMKKEIQGAVTTGVLNLSAMSLHELPTEVLTMYEFKEDSGIAWSETVDLQKLILADNDINVLPDAAFPDWSEEDMLADADKSNQFAGLDVLDVHGNNLTSIPVGFRRLQQLSVLNVSNNSLDLSVFSTISELADLKELRLSKNGLSGALPTEITKMTELRILDLRDNQLDELPASISELRNLQKLFLGGNRFSLVPLGTLPAEGLLELDVSHNMLSGTLAADELKAFKKLQSLDVSFNSLGSICAGELELPALQTLAVHNNRIAELPDLSLCTGMTTLTASENSLKAIPESFYGLTSLRNVDLSGNSIKTIEASIMSMEKLSGFNIAGNPLREKKYLTMNVDEIRADFARKAAPADSANVKSSHAGSANGQGMTAEDDGDATEVQVHKPKGGVLDLSPRNLSSLDPADIDLTAPVHTVRLANNDFSSFPVELLMHPSIRWSLRSLDMSHNPLLHPIDYLNSETHLPVLQSLYIVSTGLTTLDTLTTYLKAPDLRELNISCHRMAGHLPWVRAWYPSLTTLLASDNWFESIDVEAVRGLEVLDIRNNEIEVLPPKLGLLGNHAGKNEPGRLRSFECSGNRFRVPRLMVVERGTEAVLRDLRRMIAVDDVPEEWQGEV